MVKTQKRQKKIKGGSDFFGPTFTNVPINAFYPLNEHNSPDVSAPVSYTDARLLPNMMGGKRNKQGGKKSRKQGGKKSKKYGVKKSKKQKGGDGLLQNLSLNPIAGQGNYQSYSTAYNLLSGTTIQTPALTTITTSYLV
jgi:hypothetical protein